MKKIVSLLVLVFFLTSCDKEKNIPVAELSNEINDYIEMHFPNHTIIQAREDKEGFTKTFEILLDGNISLEFNKKYEIIEIDGVSELPKSVIPNKIFDYIDVNYPNNYITDWGLEDKNQEVELDNTLELVFNSEGDFLKIED